MILFGHQTGNPNAHQAALALKEAGVLGAYCTPWYPEKWEIGLLRKVPGFGRLAERFSRRRFGPLDDVRKIQGRFGEFRRLAIRSLGRGDEGLSYEINDWMMKKLSDEISSTRYQAVYTYEDCAEEPFRAAKQQGKICIYDMPTSCYAWREKREAELVKKYADWLPRGGISSHRWVRPEQKKREMELADLVLAPSSFAKDSILQFFQKKIQIAPYGIDMPKEMPLQPKKDGLFRLVFAGTVSVQKGIPLLLETWKRLGWAKSELVLAGTWQLAKDVEKNLPQGVKYVGRVTHRDLMNIFLQSDWLVFPSNSEGYGLVILEALAHGLPVLASKNTGAADLPTSDAVRLFEPENSEQLAEALIRVKAERGKELAGEARRIAQGCGWENYRKKVRAAVTSLA